jgi:hypothetical protein
MATTTERLLAWRITHPTTGAVQYAIDPVLERGLSKPGHVRMYLDGRLHTFPEADVKRVVLERTRTEDASGIPHVDLREVPWEPAPWPYKGSYASWYDGPLVQRSARSTRSPARAAAPPPGTAARPPRAGTPPRTSPVSRWPSAS